MAITYNIGPNPKWYFVNNNGKPLSGGKFYTFSSLNPSQQKLIYMDSGGVFPWPDPVTIDANGTAGPFFFKVDDTNLADGYFLLVTDANGVEIWTVDFYLPTGGGGGGGTIALDLDDLVTNGVMYRHISQTLGTPSLPLFLTVAPSAFTDLVGNNASAFPLANPSPDIVFLKDNATAQDNIDFPKFVLGDEPINGDVAPVDYFKYQCTVGGAGETVKCLQFPITAKVQNLSNQPVVGSFWAIAASGVTPQFITLEWFQYFGDGGGASAPLIQQINVPFAITNTWAKYNFSDNVPDVSGKSLGGTYIANQGPNDGLFLRVSFPLSPNTCDIGFTKLTMNLGNVASNIDYHSYDDIDSVISLPRTGDVRVSLNTFAPYGWVFCNDGVIANGNPAIMLPLGVSSARSNLDTYPLFSLLWSFSPTFVPMYDIAGVPAARGGSAIQDFSNSNQLQLTKTLGRAISSAGLASGQITTWSVGTSFGNEQRTLVANDLPPHVHGALGGGQFINSGLGVPISGGGSSFSSNATTDVQSPATANNPVSLMQPTSFWNVFLKL